MYPELISQSSEVIDCCSLILIVRALKYAENLLDRTLVICELGSF